MAASKRKRSDASDYSAPPDDVSQDFKDALQDLSGNDRYQISNLTIIAKESTEHAMSISEVLLRHISTVSPTRKLPAFYVLDSIVKNVGTPYANFLSRNLYKTFMEAYTLVDPQTRKQMESMLKTWKEPVPGSLDKQPVFPVDTTRPIDNALIKARTMFIEQQKSQQHQQAFQPRPSSSHALPPRPLIPTAQPWRETPTPPQYNSYNPPPPSYYPPPTYQAPPHLPPQIQSPSLNFQPQFQPSIPQHYPDQPTPQQYALPHPPPSQTYPSHSPIPPYVSQPTPEQAPLPNSYSLAALLQSSGTFAQQPPAPQAPSEPQQPQVQFPGLEALFKHRAPAEFAAQNPYDRIPTPQPPTSTSTPVQSHLFTPPVNPATLVRPAEMKNDAQLTISSLKIRRPGLLHTLYTNRPSQCTTCGRRFPATAKGKARKSRHLDAHFRTNMKFTQQESQGGRGVSRSWYVGEVDWIGAREYDDADEPDAGNAGHAAGSTATGKGGTLDGTQGLGSASAGNLGGKGAAGWGNMAERYIKAPADAAMAKYACPICQEEFSAVWHDEAQEWVWMDAVKVGDKVYHGSCLGEMAKDRGGGIGGVGTPAMGAAAKAKVEA